MCPDLTPNKPWTVLEDALLLQLYEQHGPKWTTIADHLSGRSPTACRNRSRKYQMGRRDCGKERVNGDSACVLGAELG